MSNAIEIGHVVSVGGAVSIDPDNQHASCYIDYKSLPAGRYKVVAVPADAKPAAQSAQPVSDAYKSAAQAVADDVVRDAERYRFLRDNDLQWWITTGHWRLSRHGSLIADGVHKNYEAAVDAAMRAAQQQKVGGA